MRQRMSNAFFDFLYPGRQTGQGDPPANAVQIAIPNDGAWVAIEGDSPHREERSAALFYNSQSLRDLAQALDEAADMLENNRKKGKR